MKLIRKYGFEILLGILGVAFFTGTLYIILVMPEDLMVRGTIMFGLFFDGIAMYYVFRQLWRTKWRYRVMPALQKVFEKLAKVFKIIGKKLGIKEREPQTVLKGRSIIFFDTKPINEQTKRKKKPSAWKKWRSNSLSQITVKRKKSQARNRLTFLYGWERKNLTGICVAW